MKLKELFNTEKVKCSHPNLQFVPLDFNGSGFFACADCNNRWTPFYVNPDPLPLEDVIKKKL